MKIRIFLTCFLLYIFTSCATDIVDLTGNIQGMVRDYDTGAYISNCNISLMPGGYSVSTGNDGLFSFSNLAPGKYTITIQKSGYNEETHTVNVITGQTSTISVALKAKSAFALSESNYDFGDLNNEKIFMCYNNSGGQCSYQIKNIPDWVKLDKTSGTLQPGGNDSFVVFVDRSKVEEGTHSCELLVAYNGNVSGTQALRLTMKKVQLTTPTVTIATSATNITRDGFDIQGAITATGGAQITEYGHCWSLSPLPTIDDSHKNYGNTDKIASFTTIVTGLNQNTTYYVRAYAKNSQGIAYSDQISVSTQNASSDKWDGTKAKSFAGGSGTKSDPYRIETGSQLVLLKDYGFASKTSVGYFELSNDIDLDNKPWPEINLEFVVLDGKGHTIYNLKVSRSGDNLGLFATTFSSTIKNLTVNGVNINAPASSNVGAFVGTSETNYNGYDKFKSSIINCSVILNENSIIKGSSSVGGIAGCIFSSAGVDKPFYVEGCRVDSSTSNNVIIGNNHVGGIFGYVRYGNIIDSHAAVSILGTEGVGGICGLAEGPSTSLYCPCVIQSCSYNGRIDGESAVGGIMGNSKSSMLIACKSTASINASNDYVGGITGVNDGNDSEDLTIIACYANGTINCESRLAEHVGGISGQEYGYIYHSYSTVTSSHQNFDGIAPLDGWWAKPANAAECATITSSRSSASENSLNCENITEAMIQFYSSYSEYFNFNNTWIWTGKVNGATKNISCPKLCWE